VFHGNFENLLTQTTTENAFTHKYFGNEEPLESSCGLQFEMPPFGCNPYTYDNEPAILTLPSPKTH